MRMANHLRPEESKFPQNSMDNPEEPQIRKRPEVKILVDIRLRPEQVEPFQNDLEWLCNQYLNMGKDDDYDEQSETGQLSEGSQE